VAAVVVGAEVAAEAEEEEEAAAAAAAAVVFGSNDGISDSGSGGSIHKGHSWGTPAVVLTTARSMMFQVST
jgi:hypothetical protein